MSDQADTWPREFVADESVGGKRLDAALALWIAGESRATLKRAIDAGAVLVDGRRVKPAHRLTIGEPVRVERLEPRSEGPKPEAIPLDLLYEDEDVVAVNKPSGMVVHPARGHWSGTLASALAHHFGENLSSTGGPTRPGIVHRLDRDTTGVIVVAKNDRAHERLAAQFADRTTEKTYLVIVGGVPDRDADVIDEPIGPHPKVREKVAIRRDHPDARPAVTTYEVVERFRGFTLLRAKPKTGRTHQIRVHLAHAGFAVLCDKQYGGRSRVARGELLTGRPVEGEPPLLERQALHAHRLQIDHPTSGERLCLEAPLSPDIGAVLRVLRGEA
ncbi:MAG: RluA family pseudouridine synthase [Planctomycetota bacterium]